MKIACVHAETPSRHAEPYLDYKAVKVELQKTDRKNPIRTFVESNRQARHPFLLYTDFVCILLPDRLKNKTGVLNSHLNSGYM